MPLMGFDGLRVQIQRVDVHDLPEDRFAGVALGDRSVEATLPAPRPSAGFAIGPRYTSAQPLDIDRHRCVLSEPDVISVLDQEPVDHVGDEVT